MAEDNQDLTYRWLANATLYLLAIIATAIGGLALSVLNGHDARLRVLEATSQRTQDVEEQQAWRIQQLESLTRTLESEESATDHQAATNQLAIRTLSDAVNRIATNATWRDKGKQ